MKKANTEHLDMHCQATQLHTNVPGRAPDMPSAPEPSTACAWEKLPGKGKGEFGDDQGAQQLLLPQQCKTLCAEGQEQGE